MDRYQIDRGRSRTRWSPATKITLLVIGLILLLGARSIASYTIDFEWWKIR